jgi:hypothetical protein
MKAPLRSPVGLTLLVVLLALASCDSKAPTEPDTVDPADPSLLRAGSFVEALR